MPPAEEEEEEEEEAEEEPPAKPKRQGFSWLQLLLSMVVGAAIGATAAAFLYQYVHPQVTAVASPTTAPAPGPSVATTSPTPPPPGAPAIVLYPPPIPPSPPPPLPPPPSPPPPPPPPPPIFSDVLASGGSLSEGQLMSDTTGTHVLILQNNGNLVMESKGTGTSKIVWQSGVIPNPAYNPFVLTLQISGALVLQDAHGATIWSIPAPGTLNPPYQLVLQDDGNLVLYGQAGAYWGSGTNGL